MNALARRRWAGILVLGLALACTAALPGGEKEPAPGGGVKGGDWPTFGGSPRRNMVDLVERGLPTEWSVKEGERKDVRWVAELGMPSYGSPAVAAGKVFVGTSNSKPRDPKVEGDKAVLMCFGAADGGFLWQRATDMPPRDVVREAATDGLCSTPTIDGDRLYYVTPAAEVVCADLAGTVVWRLDMMKDLKVFPCYVANCCPVVTTDQVFVVTGNGRDADNNLPAPEAPSFVALDKKTGAVQWQSNAPGDRIMEGQWSNPAYAEINGKPQVIFPGGDGWLYGFEPKSGKLLWKFDCNPKNSEFKPGGGGNRNYLVATPVVYENKVYVGVGRNPDSGSGVGHLWCIDPSKASPTNVDLSPVGDNFDPQAAANKSSGLVWHYGGPAPAGGARDYTFGRTISTCAIHEGLVYAAELDGFLHCLDARTGKQFWEHDLQTGVWSSPLWADGKVYLGDDDGDVLIFAHGKEKKLLGKIEMEEPVKGPAVAAGGVLYVMTEKHLYAIGGK